MAIYCAKPLLLCLVAVVLVCYDPLAAEEKPRDSESEARSVDDVEESPEELQEYEEDLLEADDIDFAKRGKAMQGNRRGGIRSRRRLQQTRRRGPERRRGGW